MGGTWGGGSDSFDVSLLRGFGDFMFIYLFDVLIVGLRFMMLIYD